MENDANPNPALIQSMDYNVIQNIKLGYRKLLLTTILNDPLHNENLQNTDKCAGPYRLKAGPVDEVARDFDGVYAFTDDNLIASKTHQEHVHHLRELFKKLDHCGHTKCKFGASDLEFLGFHISENGLQPLSDLVEVIQKFPKSKILTQLNRVLGMHNFYRRFILRAAHILAPLNKFLEGHRNKKKSFCLSKKTKNPLQWTDEAKEAFNLAKQALADATLLK
ncbi:hypothetical protein AVEN_181677-1 [Araneus ventricosus]|uniref:Reverse transcriptase domain-containing protein n=1 Tax=Araneus ventricosus TaxID=182803 RepID=A0A4Y2X4L2_ARAVE|nr:hypothetical protein AVEN_181677-1 [Araneus ventricosus]